MESYKVLSAILTNFSHSNYILRYYGTYLECRKLMRSLGVKTKCSWIKNIRAYKYGTRADKRKILEYIGQADSKGLDSLKYNNLYAMYSIMIKIKDDVNLLHDVIDFIGSVEEPESIHFEAIYISHWLFEENISLVNELGRTLLEATIKPFGVKFEYPLGVKKSFDEKVEWCPRCVLYSFWNDFKRVGGLEAHLTEEKQIEYLAEFNKPIEHLYLVFSPKQFHIDESKFSKEVLNSVRKVTVRFKNGTTNASTLSLCQPKDFRIFKKLKNLNYANIQISSTKESLQYSLIEYLLRKVQEENFSISIVNGEERYKPLFEINNAEGWLGVNSEPAIRFRCKAFKYFKSSCRSPLSITKNEIELRWGDVYDLVGIYDVDTTKYDEMIEFLSNDERLFNRMAIRFKPFEYIWDQIEDFYEPKMPIFCISQVKSKYVYSITDQRKRYGRTGFFDFKNETVLPKLYVILDLCLNEETSESDLYFYNNTGRKVPIAEITLSVNLEYLKNMGITEKEELMDSILQNKSIKFLTIVNDSSSEKTTIGNLDLETPNPEDEELFEAGIESLFMKNFIFVFDYRQKDNIKISPI